MLVVAEQEADCWRVVLPGYYARIGCCLPMIIAADAAADVYIA